MSRQIFGKEKMLFFSRAAPGFYCYELFYYFFSI